MEAMNDTGMTDLQFKSWLRQIIRGIESAKQEKTKEETDKKIDELLKDLKEDLHGWRIARVYPMAIVLHNTRIKRPVKGPFLLPKKHS